MPSPSTVIRGVVKDVLESEFAAESLTVLDDRLHPSLGAEGSIAGVSPLDEAEVDRQASTVLTRVRVQVYMHWDKEVDNAQTVDPGPAEDWADRFRKALRTHSQGTTADNWFLRLVQISYPPDPTGNITRFEAEVHGWGANTGLVETV